jgi:hypothetical protein
MITHTHTISLRFWFQRNFLKLGEVIYISVATTSCTVFNKY